ncbi:ABC transporter substrate-binding protein [Blastococcus sp. SYSU D00820]
MHSVPRRLTGAAVALAALLTASACSDDAGSGSGSGNAASGDGGWSFTDDMGTTVELDAAPTRVAGLNDVTASLWNYGIAPVATFGQTSSADDVAFEGRDLGDVSIVGETYGQIDLEQLAAADPDVIVTSVYPQGGELDPELPLYGFESLEQQEQVAEIAPIIAIAYQGSAADVIDRVVELAEALGADEDLISAGREQFDAASATLTEAAAGGVTVLPVYATAAEGWNMAKAPDDPALALYQELGVQFVDPGGDGYFWEVVGWEEITNYPSDVILYSLRGGETPEEMAEQPTFTLLPAVQAGQTYPWKYVGMDYVAQAAYMEELAGWLAESQKVT